MSGYEYDDKGVLCYYDTKTEGWLTCECSCMTCGYREGVCVCEGDDCDLRDPDIILSCVKCGACRYGAEDEASWVKKGEDDWFCYGCDSELETKKNEVCFQVRINDGDKGFLRDAGGNMDMDCIHDAFRAIVEYEQEEGGIDKEDTLTITRTPVLSEEECDLYGVEYKVEVVFTIKGSK